jgi:hypothetical protein
MERRGKRMGRRLVARFDIRGGSLPLPADPGSGIPESREINPGYFAPGHEGFRGPIMVSPNYSAEGALHRTRMRASRPRSFIRGRELFWESSVRDMSIWESSTLGLAVN